MTDEQTIRWFAAWADLMGVAFKTSNDGTVTACLVCGKEGTQRYTVTHETDCRYVKYLEASDRQRGGASS